MKLSERIAALEARIKILEDRLIQQGYEQPDFIPDDKDAPDWARWKAMDMSGKWYWYSRKPRISISVWDAPGNSHFKSYQFCTNTDRIDREYWKRSLMEVKR